MNATNAEQTSLRAEQKAHEPSMEDILASIRKIIADDDALPLSRRATPARPTPDPSKPEQPAKPEPVEAKRANAEPAPVAAPANSPLKPPPIPNLRDLALRLDSIPLRSAPPVELAPEALALRPSIGEAPDGAPVADAVPTENFAAAPNKPVETRPVVAAVPASHPEPVAAPKSSVGFATGGFQAAPLSFQASVAPPVGVAPAKTAPVAVAPMVEPEAPFADIQPAPVKVQAPPVMGALSARMGLPAARTDRAEPAMLSENSGLKVSAAFEALAESALLRDPEMVERMTREILRPMIKTWLDDNLPNVVERLVRAEIERVARGPRG